jgi:serine/threonine protein kinase
MDEQVPGHYKNLEEIGSGSFGQVFRAYDEDRNQTSVIKKISKKDRRGADNTEKILSEVKILSAVQSVCNQGILCYLDFMETPKNFYIVTEYLENYQGLDQIIETQKDILDWQLYRLLMNMCRGLQLIHSMEIAHRDIKPENIMYNISNMDIKFIDFGLACYKEDCNKPDSLGSALYMAPELFVGRIPSSLQGYIKTDYWSLGIVMLEIIPPILEEYSLMEYLGAFRKLKLEQDIEDVIKIDESLITTGVTDNDISRYISNYPNSSSFKSPLIMKFINRVIKPLLRAKPKNRTLNLTVLT